MKPVAHLAQRPTCATQEMLAAICHYSKSPGLSSLSVTQLLCWPSPAEQLPLAFFKACFNCKEQNLVTEENIPCLFIDSQVREQKQLRSQISVCSGATPSSSHWRDEMRRNNRATGFLVPSDRSFEPKVRSFAKPSTPPQALWESLYVGDTVRNPLVC